VAKRSSRQAPSSDAHFHPQEWYREHLLDAFQALGPSVDRVAVRKWLIQRLCPVLFPGDFEMVNTGQSERWWHFVDWNRNEFRKEGLVHPSPKARTATGTYVSPLGRWELTEKGKQLIEACKSRQPIEPRQSIASSIDLL
jgi:hypothetical protein